MTSRTAGSENSSTPGPARCFLVVGPESAGNRLLAAVLVEAGCIGDGSTEQRWDPGLPNGPSPAVVIRSFPHGEGWPDLPAIYRELSANGYQTVTLVTARHPAALIGSQVAQGHAGDHQQALIQASEAYERIFKDIQRPFLLVPYSAIAGGCDSRDALCALLGLQHTTDEVTVDGQRGSVEDRNPTHFDGPVPSVV